MPKPQKAGMTVFLTQLHDEKCNIWLHCMFKNVQNINF